MLRNGFFVQRTHDAKRQTDAYSFFVLWRANQMRIPSKIKVEELFRRLTERGWGIALIRVTGNPVAKIVRSCGNKTYVFRFAASKTTLTASEVAALRRSLFLARKDGIPDSQFWR